MNFNTLAPSIHTLLADTAAFRHLRHRICVGLPKNTNDLFVAVSALLYCSNFRKEPSAQIIRGSKTGTGQVLLMLWPMIWALIVLVMLVPLILVRMILVPPMFILIPMSQHFSLNSGQYLPYALL